MPINTQKEPLAILHARGSFLSDTIDFERNQQSISLFSSYTYQ